MIPLYFALNLGAGLTATGTTIRPDAVTLVLAALRADGWRAFRGTMQLPLPAEMGLALVPAVEWRCGRCRWAVPQTTLGLLEHRMGRVN